MSLAKLPVAQTLTELERHDLESTLALEFGANRRYEYQIDVVQNPRINAMLEGIKRNERDHIESSSEALRQAQQQSVRGFATILQVLETDLRFEEEAIKSYSAFANNAVSPEVRAYFLELSRSEAGHRAELTSVIKEIKSGEFVVAFYCPQCGWEIAFGGSPSVGQQSKCAKCGFVAELTLDDGDWGIVKAAK